VCLLLGLWTCLLSAGAVLVAARQAAVAALVVI